MQLAVNRELIPLSAPFTITGYTFTDMSVVVARVAERGATGEGEAAGVYYLGDDADCMCVALEAVRHDVEAGIDRAALKRLLPPGGARNALDCALWDLESKRLRQPVWRIAGLERPRPLVTTFTIPANDPGAMAAKAIEYAQAKSLKLKLTGEMPLDAERVRAVRKARPDAWMGVDANQGFTPDTLTALMPDLVSCKVKLVEQPFEQRDGRRVQPGKRLVGQQQVRVVQQRPRDGKPLDHPAAERLHGVVRAPEQVEAFERGFGAPPRLAQPV